MLTLISLLLISSVSFSTSLKDIPYNFNKAKLAETRTSLDFLRSYADYFYLLINANKSQLTSLEKNWNTAGWCVGDAHPENFGFVILENSASLFTVNDMDDSGPCPLVLDLARLMVSSKLAISSIDLNKLVESYVRGLESKARIPEELEDLYEESQDKGRKVGKSRLDSSEEKLKRTKESSEVNSKDQLLITHEISKVIPRLKLIDIMATHKISGGSAGMLRFEVLLEIQGNLRLIELKELTDPAIQSVASEAVPSAYERIKKTLLFTQGSSASNWYEVLKIGNKNFLMRPRFAGNEGVNLQDQSAPENKEIIYYEALRLGNIHAQSLRMANTWGHTIRQQKDLSKDILSLVEHFQNKYRDLKK